MRGRIEVAARNVELTPRDFAATLVGCIIGNERAKILHVGDGAAVYRVAESEEWAVGSWPSHGEYASTTYFVTDDPEPAFQLTEIEGEVSELAVFTDGIEHLVLNFSTGGPFPPFFNQMFSGFKSEATGKSRELSRHLCKYLSGPSICDRTDDDKTLLLARRNTNVASQEHI
jgi:hypothetical protein